MITTLQINNLRGIREATLEGLSPLVVLVGPNGAGKSTVLDGLMIGASPRPGDAIGRSVLRRSESRNGARWLLWRAGEEGPARVRVVAMDGSKRETELVWKARGGGRSEILSTVRLGQHSANVNVSFDETNVYEVELEAATDAIRLRDVPDVRVVEPHAGGLNSSLPDVFSRAEESGRSDVAKDALRSIVPGLRDVVLLSESNVPVVHLKFAGYTVPVSLAGDGIYSLVRLGFELAARPRGLVLIEEPEVHQHPGAMRQTARLIAATVARGVQVVLSTHSLEMIDALLSEVTAHAGEAGHLSGLTEMSVYRLALAAGQLRSTRLSGEELELSRLQIADDLR